MKFAPKLETPGIYSVARCSSLLWMFSNKAKNTAVPPQQCKVSNEVIDCHMHAAWCDVDSLNMACQHLTTRGRVSTVYYLIPQPVIPLGHPSPHGFASVHSRQSEQKQGISLPTIQQSVGAPYLRIFSSSSTLEAEDR